MPRLVFVPCTVGRCGRHQAGYRNLFGLCYCSLTIYFLLSNRSLQEQLRVCSLALGRRARVAKFLHPLLLDLRHQMNTRQTLHPEVLLREIGIDYKQDGGYAWEAYEKLSEQLQTLGIFQVLRVIRSPCTTDGCDRVTRNYEDMHYLDLPNSTELLTSFAHRFNNVVPLHIHCNYCRRLTDRRMQLSITRLPDYLVLKITQNMIFTFPLELNIPQEYIHRSIIEEQRLYGYYGHCKVTGRGMSEHNETIIRDQGLLHSLHKYNNDVHSVADIPLQTITDNRVDVIIYEKIVNGVRRSEMDLPVQRNV